MMLWLGVLIFVAEWTPSFLLRYLFLALPLGSALGFDVSNNVYRTVRSKQIPPSD